MKNFHLSISNDYCFSALKRKYVIIIQNRWHIWSPLCSVYSRPPSGCAHMRMFNYWSSRCLISGKIGILLSWRCLQLCFRDDISNWLFSKRARWILISFNILHILHCGYKNFTLALVSSIDTNFDQWNWNQPKKTTVQCFLWYLTRIEAK